MTTITGTIEDSGGGGLTGTLRVTLDGPLVDTSSNPDSVQVPRAKDFAIAGGSVNINLTESQTLNLTYRFQFLVSTTTNAYYFVNGDLYTGPKHFWTDNNWYTGPVHTVDSVLLYEQPETTTETLLDFHAIVPNVASTQFSSLVPTGVTTDVLDTSIRRLAEILTSSVDYVEALRGGPRWMGVYNPVTFYQRDDAVSYGGSSWVYINANPAAGQAPSDLNTTYWLKLAAKGDAGGTGGNDTAYDPTGWNGATDAPSRNAVRDVFVTLAPLASPSLTGNPTAPTQAVGNDTTRLATTAFVVAEILSRFASPALTGAPTAPTQADTTNNTAIASTGFVKNVYHRYSRLVDVKTSGTAGGTTINGIQTRNLNTIATNAGDIISLASNQFVLRAGTYRIFASAPAYRCDAHRIFLWNVSDSARTLNGKSSSAANTDNVQSLAVLNGVFTISANKTFEIRHYTTVSIATFGLGIAAGEASQSEIYTEVELWRLD